jgi:hypothetical protein
VNGSEKEFLPPTTKQELMDHIQRGYDLLNATLKSLTPEDMLLSESEGQWSVKDHLAHLAMWRRKALADLQERPAWEGLGVMQKEMQENDIDGINALIYQHWHTRSLQDVLDAFHVSHSALVYQVKKTTEERLFKPYTPIGSAEPQCLVDGIVGNTYEHDLEHQEYIGEMLKNRQKGRANPG